MSCFEKLTHVLWHCQYHIVWVPKYRYRVLTGDVAREVHNCIQVYSSRLGCRVIELNVQPDHVHLLVKVPPKVSISKLLGVVKGKTALRIFTKFPYLRNKPYWGVTTHPYQHRAVPKRPFEWRPADCIPDLPWSAGKGLGKNRLPQFCNRIDCDKP